MQCAHGRTDGERERRSATGRQTYEDDVEERHEDDQRTDGEKRKERMKEKPVRGAVEQQRASEDSSPH